MADSLTRDDADASLSSDNDSSESSENHEYHPWAPPPPASSNSKLQRPRRAPLLAAPATPSSYGWRPSQADIEWVRRVTCDGNSLAIRASQDSLSSSGSLGLYPRPAKPRKASTAAAADVLHASSQPLRRSASTSALSLSRLTFSPPASSSPALLHPAGRHASAVPLPSRPSSS
jgi:hypothetical protein